MTLTPDECKKLAYLAARERDRKLRLARDNFDLHEDEETLRLEQEEALSINATIGKLVEISRVLEGNK